MPKSASAREPILPHRHDAGEVITLDQLLQNGAVAGSEVVPGLAPTPPGGVREIGGRKNGLEPTRYGDWEKDGRCIDF